MNRWVTLFLILGLTVGLAATAEAKKTQRNRVERTVEGGYDTQFVPFAGLVTNPCAQEGAIGCVTIETRAKEAFLTAKVVDAHAQPVFVTVSGPDPYRGPGYWVDYGTFCGETDEPIPFPRGVDVSFSIGYFWLELPTSMASCPPMFGTTGTVSVTLSNLP